MSAEEPDPLSLFVHFALICAVAVGGINPVLPDLQRYLVTEHGWLTARQFGDLFALAQASPGPNVMIVSMLGWMVAGWAGAIATTVALFLPGGLMTVAVIRYSVKRPDATFLRLFRRGMTPLVIGLMFASGMVLTLSVNHSWAGYALTALTVAVVMLTKINPLWLIGAGAMLGIAGAV